MKILSLLKRAVALGVLSASLALSGCGGSHGGGSSASPADRVAAAFKSGNFDGAFDSSNPAFRSRSTTPTSASIQFASNGGVISFASGTSGTATFHTFSADITNVNYENVTSTSTGAAGTISFDLVNFTTNDYLSGTAHFTANYTVTAANFQLLTTGGKITGTGPSGSAVNLGFNLDYQPLLAKINLAGNYSGTIDLPSLTGTSSKSWTGSLTAVDDLHLTMSIKTSLGTILFNGQNTHSTFAGSFDGTQISSLATGTFAQFYVQTNDNGATINGAYILVDSAGVPFLNPLTSLPVVGTITAKKTTSGGGTATFTVGNYDGGLKPNGTANGRIMRLNVVKASSTTGANGGMVIITNSAAPNIGGRIASVSVVGSTATITVDSISNTYSKIVITGDIQSGSSALSNAAYVATLTGGTTEQGTFDQLGRVSVSTSNLTASWSGTATSTVNGHVNTFAANFKSNDDGTVLITPTSTIGGGTYPVITIPAFTAYQAENSFAGHVNGTVVVTSLGTPLTVRVIGDFDGDANSTAIAGSYTYSAGLDGGASLISDTGTLSLTKH